MQKIELSIKREYSENKTPSSFSKDSEFEKKSADYLKKFTTFRDDFGIKEEITDKENQLSGIDYTAELNGKKMNVDAKAIAQNYSTFSFELEGSVKTRQLGWFLQKNKTTHYALIYHSFKTCDGYYMNKKKDFDDETISSNEVILIEKEKLVKEVNSWLKNSKHGSLEAICDDLRTITAEATETKRFIINERGNLVEKLPTDKSDMVIVVTKSSKVTESPINLVINKRVLKAVSDKIANY